MSAAKGDIEVRRASGTGSGGPDASDGVERPGWALLKRPIPHAGRGTDPDLTSPARRYLAMITPLGDTLLSMSSKPA